MGLVVVCALAGGAWLLLVLIMLGGRLRARTARVPVPASAGGEWQLSDEAIERAGLRSVDSEETRRLLARAIRSAEPEVRVAGITALGGLGERHEWAIDGLVEALVHEGDDAVKVASHLDRLAPRPGPRLPPLLGHPSGTVRFYAVRLLARYETLAARHVPAMTGDTSPNVRAAALETLRAVASGEALRCALRLLDDPSPLVRAHAARTAAAIAPQTAASFLVPLLSDRSWWVREAVREGLVAGGRGVADTIDPALESEDVTLRSGAALVLQDVGLLDELVGEDELRRLERILDAGGRRLREAAADRARSGLRLGPAQAVGAEAVS